MGKKTYQVGAYAFASKAEYERAKKEQETIQYLMANTNTADGKSLLKIYNRSIEKGSFQTAVGLEFLINIRRRLVDSGMFSEDTIAPIPVAAPSAPVQDGADRSKPQIDPAKQVQRYKDAYEAAVAGRKIRNMAIIILLVVVMGMLLITYRSEYSVFTYFTNYKEKIRNEVVDEYEDWQNQLEEKEKQLEKRQSTLDAK